MGNEKLILLIVVAGSIVTFALIMVIIVFVSLYQKKMVARENAYLLSIKNKEVELLQSVIVTQESERKKIAMNLHDSINPHLTALKLILTKRERELKVLISDGGVEMKQEKQLIDEIVTEIGSITRDLSPQVLFRYGLSSALNSFVINIQEIDAFFKETNPGNLKMNDAIALNVYRIGLELIQNVLKHEKCTRIQVNIVYEQYKLILEIAHDGAGISNLDFVRLSDSSIGIGLDSLKSRTLLLNGQLDYQNETESKIVFTLPLRDEKTN
jgi:two-component system NarL family sensor kinase